jgi:hypothetical protein
MAFRQRLELSGTSDPGGVNRQVTDYVLAQYNNGRNPKEIRDDLLSADFAVQHGVDQRNVDAFMDAVDEVLPNINPHDYAWRATAGERDEQGKPVDPQRHAATYRKAFREGVERGQDLARHTEVRLRNLSRDFAERMGGKTPALHEQSIDVEDPQVHEAAFRAIAANPAAMAAWRPVGMMSRTDRKLLRDHFWSTFATEDRDAFEKRFTEGTVGRHPGTGEHRTAEAHQAKTAYHRKLAEGDARGAVGVATHDHRFHEHLQGHQAEQHPARTVMGQREGKQQSTQKFHSPDPTDDPNHDGIPDASRVGVPAFSTPPPPPVIPRLPNLNQEERQVEDRFAKHFEADPDGVAAAYVEKLKSREIGDAPNVFNTDDAKLLSGDYNPQGVDQNEVFDARSKYNVAVHQTANAIAKRAFVKYLDDVVRGLPEDRRTVLVTSGGVASGKGYAIGQVESVNEVAQSVGAVWDAAGEQNATENPWILEQCKQRGIKPIFVFVHADPAQTWENPKRGVIERAQKKGRMVDARLFADSYAIGAKNFKAFYDKHKDSGDADFVILENVTTPRLLDERHSS